jgi:hypothetical protein
LANCCIKGGFRASLSFIRKRDILKIIAPITITDSNLTYSNVSGTDNPAYNPIKLYISGETVQLANRNYESLTGSQSNVTISTSSPATITWNNHGLVLNTPIQFSTTGSLPTGLSVGTTYYVISPSTTSFNVALTPNGSPIATSGTQSGVHTARASNNIGKDPTTATTFWLDLGTVNKYKMFDTSVQSQTVNSGSIVTVIQVSGYSSHVALLNIVGTDANVVMTHPTDGVVYNQTKSLRSSSGITDWFKYFFTPSNPITDLVFDGIPNYANTTITVTINNAGGSAACGACLIGFAKDISSQKAGVEQGAKLTLDDYSLKTPDAFGNYTIKERAFARRAAWTVYIDGKDVDGAYNLLSSRRAIPTLYIGGKDYGSNLVYGFFRSFDITINYIDFPAVCSIELAGLT